MSQAQEVIAVSPSLTSRNSHNSCPESGDLALDFDTTDAASASIGRTH